jgi:hypothetical protein
MKARRAKANSSDWFVGGGVSHFAFPFK